MNIPFFDLKKVNSAYNSKLEAAFARVQESGWYILGKELSAFEEQFASYCQTKYCVGVGNGLDALKLILLAHEIRNHDEVIVPGHTFIATWLAVSQVGATPIPVDIDETSFNVNPDLIEQRLSERTKAIIAVHLYGKCANMTKLRTIAKTNGLILIEDAAQAHGAFYQGERAGGLADAAAFSFYPSKNLGALGDGGAITTNDGFLYEKLKYLRNYGAKVKYSHEYLGTNSRLDEIQAAFLSTKLDSLDSVISKRHALMGIYQEGLKGLPIRTPDCSKDDCLHLYVVQIAPKIRAKFMTFLGKRGVQTLIHYPVPPHLSQAYKSQCSRTQFSLPNSELVAKSVVSLPLNEGMNSSEVEYVVASIKDFFHESP